MHTTCLPSVCALVATSGRGAVQWDPMKKFEQVTSDGHQISLAGGHVPYLRAAWGSPFPMSGGGQGRRGPIQWGPMHQGQWSHGDPTPLYRTTDRQTDRHYWKHYLPATLLAGANKKKFLFPMPCCFCTKPKRKNPIVIMTFQLIPRWQHSALAWSCGSDKCTTKDKALNIQKDT